MQVQIQIQIFVRELRRGIENGWSLHYHFKCKIINKWIIIHTMDLVRPYFEDFVSALKKKQAFALKVKETSISMTKLNYDQVYVCCVCFLSRYTRFQN